MSIPTTKHTNFTIIVNWKERGFGCAKACTYCNWRGSPLLPQGAQSVAALTAFIRQSRKSFITISGGGDPLYRFDENFPAFLSMSDTIKVEGYKVRVITREVQHGTCKKFCVCGAGFQLIALVKRSPNMMAN